ncbi:choice-of-anchor A family protein [Pseudodesulfovibrio portus]|uniref:Choice-of-anchor A domain-containing protein n=1 Tax=Pseudodesulfovibrio portus TaxID=231439 RepID=A0ABM8AUQ8_9BACT|nr:choice-of-anchor A family protein [Pseudodesulfovibrio portus]BDQ35113.1 hypothetical protein JCM14722_26550 [Pseudodesulfovibrio portus]
MKYIRITLFALALTVAAAPAFASSASLGLAGNYNAFIFGNFSSSSDTQGRLAVGGNVHLEHYSVGDRLNPGTTGDVLLAGGDLTFTGGRVYYGDVRVGGSVTGPGYKFYDGALYQNSDMPFDFAAQKQKYTSMANSLAALSATGTTTSQWGGLYMTGDGTSNTQVFNLDGSTLLNSHTFALDTTGFAQDTTIIFNVSGTASGLTNMSMESLRPFAGSVLFNFYEATSLTLSGIGVWGSILAPLADIDNPQGVINGTLIANSFDGPMQLNLVPFEGNVPTPIPGSILLLGTGMLGLIGWRKRR